MEQSKINSFKTGSAQSRLNCDIYIYIYIQDLKIIKNGKGYKDGMPKSIETR